MKKISLKTVVIGVLFMCFVISTTQAQSRGKKPEKRPTFSQLLEKMDGNEDGKLSEAEVKGPLKENFSSIDKDEDGFVTEEELKARPKPKRKKRSSN